MKLTISSQQYEYFEEHHVIELEGLMTHADVFSLYEGIEMVISTRLKCSIENIKKQTPEEVFLASGDLWRSNLAIRKLITSPRLSSIASILLKEKPVRLGYDLYIEPTNASFLQTLRPFGEINCIQGFIGGMCICLEGEKEGNIKVFSPEFSMDSHQMFDGKPFVLITYCQASSIYLRKLADPMSQRLRDLGYTYGDRLSDDLNPIVFK